MKSDLSRLGSVVWPLVVVVLFLASGACQGRDGGAEAGAPAAPPSVSGDSTPTEVTLPSLPAGDGETFQKGLLQDGITEAEYERAVFATLQCLVDGGGAYFSLQWVEHDGARTLQFGASGLPGFEPGDGPSLYDECWAEWSRAVEAQWSTQNEPSEAEQQAMEEAWVACVRSAGFDVQSWDDKTTIVAKYGEPGREAHLRCRASSGLSGGVSISGTRP